MRSRTLSLRAITIPAKTDSPKGLLVGLHGWGANADDLAALAPWLNLPDYQLIFPDAPFRHPYAPDGKAWYNFPQYFSFQKTEGLQDHPEVAESRRRLKDWIESLEHSTGIPLSKTVLAGFSQGGAMTLDVGLQLPLAALMVLSGFLHAPIKSVYQPTAPILMVHGRQDNIVPLSAAQDARQSLQALSIDVQYYELDMGHEIRPDVMVAMQKFIEERTTEPGKTT